VTAESVIKGNRKGNRRIGQRVAARLLARLLSQWGFAVVAWTLLLLVPMSLLLFDDAALRRTSIEQQAAALARASANTLDREFVAAQGLLAGLAGSPALESDAPARFYVQAFDAPKPPGSWIVLLGPDGTQYLSTLRPYGAVLPPASEATSRALAKIQARRQSAILNVSPTPPLEMESVGFGVPVLRHGEVSSVLALMMAKESLMRRFDEVHLPAGWCRVIRDDTAAVILRWPPVTPVFSDQASGCSETMASFPAQSQATGSNIAIAVPKSELEAPMRRALTLIGSGGLALVAIMGLAFLIDARFNRPFQARLAADEERFRMMADTVPSILFVTDADGRCEYVNRRFYEYTGMAPGTALGLGWVGAVHPEEQRRVVGNLMRPAPGDDLRLNEIRLRSREGSYRWFLWRSRPSRRQDGSVLKWFGSSSDIDDIKQSASALRRINERLSAVLSSIDECYYTMDTQWRITHINLQAASFFGKPPDELLGRSIYEVVPELGGSAIEADLTRALRERVPVRLECRSMTRTDRWIAATCYPWTEGVSVFFRDVTRQQNTEIALGRTQELLQQTMDALSAQIAILDENGTILAANAAWQQIAGRMGCGVGCDYLAACSTQVADAMQAQQMLGLLKAVLQREQRDGLVYYARQDDKGSRWFQMRATRFDAAQGPRIVVAHEDITEIKLAETGLRDLTSRLLRVQDDERRRMARELHDTTAQNLAAAILELDRLRHSIPIVDQASEQICDQLRALIECALQEIRTLSYLLHPPLLDELGLTSALRWYVRGFERRSGIAVSLTLPDDLGRMPGTVESALFRVVQEALTNIHRHSGSATAQIRLTRSAGQVALEIKDQGRGMQPHDGTDPPLLGVGVSGMRARLHQLGGELSIRSTARGTTVTATVSLERLQAPSSADELTSHAISE
jgi:PAS domain S-box-containing protein